MSSDDQATEDGCSELDARDWIGDEYLIESLTARGYTVLDPDADRQYAVGWDGRPMAISASRNTAQEGVDAAIAQQQVGRWELLERRLGPWLPAPKPVGKVFWEMQAEGSGDGPE